MLSAALEKVLCVTIGDKELIATSLLPLVTSWSTPGGVVVTLSCLPDSFHFELEIVYTFVLA
jgi:hypothetical protein